MTVSIPLLPAFTAIASILAAGLAAGADALHLAQYEHRSWSVREGAPPDVWSLTQGEDGFLWLGTGAGLYRFDGVRFERFEPTNEEGFSSNNITALTTSRESDLWLGYYFGGVSQLREGRLINHEAADGVPIGTVFRIVQDRSGAIWVATSAGLARYDRTGWQTMGAAHGFPENFASWALVDRTGTLWVTSSSALYFKVAGADRFERTDDRVGRRAVLSEAPDGTLWLADAVDGTRTVGDAEVRARLVDPDGKSLQAKRMLFDRDGVMWGTDEVHGGVFRISPVQSSDAALVVERFGMKQGLTANIAVPLLQDSEGNLWVGSNLGIDQFRRTPVVREIRIDATSRDGYTMIADGNDILVADSRSLTRLSANNHRRLTALSRRISSGFRGHDGDIWLAQPDALLRVRGDHLSRTPLPEMLQGHGVQAIAQHEGALWLSVDGRGVFQQKNDVWTDWSSRIDNAGASPNVITPDGERLWFGYPDSRVVVLSETGITSHSSSEGLNVGHVMAVSPGRGNVWIGGERGLARYDGKRFSTLDMSRVRDLHGISGLIETEAGELWINAGAGVVRIAVAEIEHLLADPARAADYRLFDYRDGLPGVAQQSSPLPTAVADNSGRLWFATNHGIAWIDPTQIRSNPVVPRLAVNSLRANEERYQPAASLVLPAGHSSLSIDYTALSLSVPERVRFRHRLHGLDSHWQEAGTRREAFYTNLDPGDYRFQVTASNDDGLWNETGASLEFRIPPTFLQSRTFLLLCAGAAAISLWLLYLLRVRQITVQLNARLRERLQERERIARELHDTFLQSVQGLILRFQSAASRIPADQPARQLMEKALERADAVLVEGRDRVRELRSKPRAEDIAESLSRAGDDLRGDSTIDLRVTVNGSARELHTMVRDEALRIGTEALHNAFRHAQAATIEIEVTYDDRQFSLAISDDGRGLDVARIEITAASGHWGLIGMRERAARIGGSLDLWSREGAGTKIQLRVPARIAYARHRELRPPRARRRLPRAEGEA